MKKIKTLWKIFKCIKADKIILFFIILTFIISALILIIEPDIKNYSDSLWYCFSVITTIGFGDFTATTFTGRILTIILSLFSMLIIALMTGVVVSYYNETLKFKTQKYFKSNKKNL